MLAVEPDLLKK